MFLSEDARTRIAASFNRFLAVWEALVARRIDTARFFLQFVSPVGRLRSCMVNVHVLRDASGVMRQSVNTYVDLEHLPGWDFTSDLSVPYDVNVDERRLVTRSSPPRASGASSPAQDEPPIISRSPERPGVSRKKSDPPHKWRVVSEKPLSAQTTLKKRLIDPTFKCDFCGTTSTPEVRTGPRGKKTLCNRCGLRWAQSRVREFEGSSKIEPDNLPWIG